MFCPLKLGNFSVDLLMFQEVSTDRGCLNIVTGAYLHIDWHQLLSFQICLSVFGLLGVFRSHAFINIDFRSYDTVVVYKFWSNNLFKNNNVWRLSAGSICLSKNVQLKQGRN